MYFDQWQYYLDELYFYALQTRIAPITQKRLTVGASSLIAGFIGHLFAVCWLISPASLAFPPDWFDLGRAVGKRLLRW